MTVNKFDYPPILTGTAEEQLRQLWDYLYQLIEVLNLNENSNKGE